MKETNKQLNKRQNDILSFAEKQGYVSVENLAKLFSVTQQTIRRDINYLSDNELLVRTHGGAYYSSGVKNFAYVGDHRAAQRCTTCTAYFGWSYPRSVNEP